VLGQDLTDLIAIHAEQRAPAVVFYCGRILEALVASAAEHFFGEATTSAAPNLNRLRELGVLSWPRDAELAALRRLGQDAVLARRQIHWADADAAVLLLERLLTWYFVELDTGPRLPTLAGETLSELVADEELVLALNKLEMVATDSEPAAWQRLPIEHPGAFLRSPAVAGLFLERSMAMARPDWEQVNQVATLALRSFPTNVQLRQLLADVLSARGDGAEALRVLEDLHRDYPADPDTLRRLGHLYRQSWLEVGVEESEPMLRRALQCYQEAWSRSRETDNESGVNAAVLGLHRGRAHRAEAIAQTIVESYRRRWLALGARFKFWGFDDRVALAHCALILGESEYARRRYLEAFELPTANKRGVAAVKRQLKAMLAALDVPMSPARFLEGGAIKRRRARATTQLEFPQFMNFEELQRT
jgi:tetratricopeptide (TPR) repeat protein